MPGAFPYAFRRSDSRLFRSYVLVGGLAALALSAAFVLALIYLVGGTFGARAGVFTFSRSFYVVVALFVVAPVVAPVLLVARRHRTGRADRRYDRALAASGYLFLLSIYLMLVVSAPAELRDPAAEYGALEPAIRVLYDLPPLSGLAAPLSAAVVVYLVHRWLR
ncbi:putative membrane protein [Halapricum desulfuricans]|uniref:Putative membrane protein n=1 Tax=Halapricum desulfuricans TaxID=2841257 RepID=A0A897MXP1_9EURY|nr:putative membrane protein [Halapricum desulfuricans]